MVEILFQHSSVAVNPQALQLQVCEGSYSLTWVYAGPGSLDTYLITPIMLGRIQPLVRRHDQLPAIRTLYRCQG